MVEVEKYIICRRGEGELGILCKLVGVLFGIVYLKIFWNYLLKLISFILVYRYILNKNLYLYFYLKNGLICL